MTSNDCLFCKIAAGEVPASIVYENDHVVAFDDINPQAPTHTLVVPKRHVPGFPAVTEHSNLFTEVCLAVERVAEEKNLTDYRVVVNNGESAGQTVFHLHFHLLGGRSFAWPPG